MSNAKNENLNKQFDEEKDRQRESNYKYQKKIEK